MVERRLASPFEVLPAIDLRGGRVVRLAQGDFEQETSFSDDPVSVATGFVVDGARWLHVVDLDGARDGQPAHQATVRAILDAVGAQASVEVAGGLRSAQSVAAMLSSGAARIVVGTAALRDPAFVGRLIDLHGPDRVAVAVDVRDGMAVGEGWRAGAPGVPIDEAIGRLADVGVRTFEVTAIDRDGLLVGPDLDLYRHVVGLGRSEVIASAGVATLADVIALRASGCRGVIVGRALYDGRLRLPDVIDAAVSPSADVVLSPRVRRRMEVDYPGVDHERAVAVLVGLDLGAWRIGDHAAGRERIHAALLRLARGDVRRLEQTAAEARVDWRDVLVAADLAGEDWPARVSEELGPAS